MVKWIFMVLLGVSGMAYANTTLQFQPFSQKQMSKYMPENEQLSGCVYDRTQGVKRLVMEVGDVYVQLSDKRLIKFPYSDGGSFQMDRVVRSGVYELRYTQTQEMEVVDHNWGMNGRLELYQNQKLLVAENNVKRGCFG